MYGFYAGLHATYGCMMAALLRTVAEGLGCDMYIIPFQPIYGAEQIRSAWWWL